MTTQGHGPNDCPSLFTGTSPPSIRMPKMQSSPLATSPIKSPDFAAAVAADKLKSPSAGVPQAGSPLYKAGAPSKLDKRLMAIKDADVSPGKVSSPGGSSGSGSPSPSIRRSSTPRLKARRRVGSVSRAIFLHRVPGSSSCSSDIVVDGFLTLFTDALNCHEGMAVQTGVFPLWCWSVIACRRSMGSGGWRGLTGRFEGLAVTQHEPALAAR